MTGRSASPDPLGLGWKHDTPLAKTATPPPLDVGRGTTPVPAHLARCKVCGGLLYPRGASSRCVCGYVSSPARETS